MDGTTIEQLLAAGQVTEAVRRMEAALAEERPPQERFALELRLAEIIALHQDDAMESLTHFGAAMQIAQEHQLPEIYRAEMGVGQALYEQGRPDQALLYLEMAATAASAASDSAVAAAAKALQGNIMMEMGQYQEAIGLMEQVEQIGRALANPYLAVQALTSLTVLHGYLEAYDAAEENGRRAIAAAKEAGDAGLVAIAYLRMGQVMYQQERFGPAYYWFKAGGEVAKEAGLEHLIPVFEEAANVTGIDPLVKSEDHG